jgi:hypothetical protein
MTLADVQTPLISFAVAVITNLVVYLLTALFRIWWIERNIKLEEKELIGSRVTVRLVPCQRAAGSASVAR